MKTLWLIAAMALGGCCCPPPGSSSSTTDDSKAVGSPSPKPAKVAEPALEITSADLYADYDANEVSADARYKGKTLAVTGKILSIDKDFLDNIVIKLKGGRYDFHAVHATLADSEKGAAANMSKGEMVELVCEGGTRIVSSPTLKDCRVR